VRAVVERQAIDGAAISKRRRTASDAALTRRIESSEAARRLQQSVSDRRCPDIGH